MDPLGRTRDGIRLIALLFLMDIVTRCRVLSMVTEDTGLLLEEETTAASSITENTEGKGQVSFRTTGLITNQSRLLEQLGAEQVTTYKPRVEAQAGLTRENNLSVSSKTEIEALNSSTTLRHELRTPSSAVFVTTTPSATSSSPTVPASGNSTAYAFQDAPGSPAPTNFTTSTISNTTPRATSDGSDLLSKGNEGLMDVTTSGSKSHRSQTEIATAMESKMPVSRGSEPPTALPGSEMPKDTTVGRRATVSDGAMDAGNSSSSEMPASLTSPSSNSPSTSSTHWYIIAAVVVLATLILIFCFVWNVRRRRKSGSTSFQNPTKKKNKKAGEDAWAGPVNMPEENCMPMDAVENEHDSSGKRLTLTTFFNKRKSRPCSVVLEEVAVQPVKSTKAESSPLLTPKANGQANGNADVSQDSQNISPTSKESSPTSGEHEPPLPPEVNSQTTAAQGPPPAQTADEEGLPPPPSPPPGTDFPAPPPSPDMQASQSPV